ncbi:hypothetical protein F5X98DRAFT_389625 [Xylaria grammica]|nr:hypothetical protein F5X98DRAFT_389625 [Xylaria grammica]
MESFTEHGILSTVVSTSQSSLASGTVPNCAIYRNFQPPPPTLDQSDSTDIISFSTEYANSCVFISGSYQVNVGDLVAWNPSLAVPNGTCGDLQPGFSYCVGMDASTGELSASNGCLQVNGTDVPLGTDPSGSCFTLIRGYDNSSTYSCEDLAADFDISVDRLTSLNPWVTNDCDAWLYDNLANTSSRAVCVSDNKTTPASTTIAMTK